MGEHWGLRVGVIISTKLLIALNILRRKQLQDDPKKTPMSELSLGGVDNGRKKVKTSSDGLMDASR